jgi:hypothetical protein
MGSRLAAFLAGRYPKIIPVRNEHEKAIITGETVKITRQ